MSQENGPERALPARDPSRAAGRAGRAAVLLAAVGAAVGAAVVGPAGAGRAAAAAAGRPGTEETLRPGLAPERAEVNLVLVDVLVRGRDGKPARGLRQESFELLVDRLPAPIASFEDYCGAPPPGGSAPGPAPPPGAAGQGAPPAPEAAPPPAPGPGREPRHVVLFFDLDHLTRAGRDRSLDAALGWVREGMDPGEKVLLLAMKGRPILLEGFTSDRERLAARIEAVKADNSMLDLSYVEERLNVHDILRRECPEGAGLCQQRLAAALPYAQAEELRARRSLEALRALMPALAGLKGRKTLIHFSETLRDEPGLQYLILAGSTPKREGIELRSLIQEVHREANAAGVSFYTVFAAGLGEGAGTGLADASVRIAAGDTVLLERSRAAGEDAALGLEATLALETGGGALKRSNDLGKVFTAAEEDMSCYYVLGYANPGPGDGRRHSLIVKVREKGYEVRHRPYFEDWSDAERLERRFRAALLAPAYYRGIGVSAAAFALAPVGTSRPHLVKVEFPMDQLTFVGGPSGRRSSEVEVRGVVWTGEKETARFGRRIPLSVEGAEETAGRRVIYEAGVELPAGAHTLSVAVLDAASWELGAAEAEVPVREAGPGIAGDVILWTSSGGDRLFAADAAGVGIHDEGSGHGFVPRRERRFGAREAGLLYVVVCPPAGGRGGSSEPVTVQRSILAGEQEVATFGAVRLGGGGAVPAGGATALAAAGGPSGRSAEPEGAGAGPDCEGIFSPIPPGRLGPGGYVYQVQVTGIGPEPIVHRAGFAVDAAEAAAEPPPGS